MQTRNNLASDATLCSNTMVMIFVSMGTFEDFSWDIQCIKSFIPQPGAFFPDPKAKKLNLKDA